MRPTKRFSMPPTAPPAARELRRTVQGLRAELRRLRAANRRLVWTIWLFCALLLASNLLLVACMR